MKNFFLTVVTVSIMLLASSNIFSQPTIEVYATGLLNPIGIEIDAAGNLWVGEQGTGSGHTASVSMVTTDHQVHKFMVDLPSSAPAFEPIGVTDVYFDIDGKLLIVTAQNTSGDTLGARVLKVDTTGFVPGQTPLNRRNIESIINLNTLLSNGNPYKITAGFENDLFVVDAYYNKVVRWHRSDGSLSVFSSFAPISQSEAVPTCIVYNDTNFFVGNLVGLPVPTGVARIYNVDLAGNNSVYQGGLTAIVDIAINPIDHSLYALQHAEFGPPWLNNKGRLFRIQNGVVDTLISGMQRPSGMVFNPNGDLFITSIQTDNILKVSNLPTAVEDEVNSVVNNFTLEQNYPNPFNPSTNIRYRISSISK
ncbi:MAG TPA: ScyD/ScyE family protein, partial [Ignavibacteriaceae bacterium]